jgi:hypothetical protein
MKEGTRVHGFYMGDYEFTGTVISSRPIFVPTDGCIQHTVQLDKAILVHGASKGVVLMHTLPDGKPSSYVRYTDHMEVIPC